MSEKIRKMMWFSFSLFIGIVASFFVITWCNQSFGQEETSSVNSEENKPGKTLVVVGKFNNKSNAPDDLFTRLRTRILNEIVNTRKFDVLEREDMENILSEMELAQRGLIKQKDGVSPGELESAAYSIYGDVLFLGFDRAFGTVGDVTANREVASVEIQLKLADLKTGKVITSKIVNEKVSKSSISSEGTSRSGNLSQELLEEAIRRAALNITNEVMELAFPTKIISKQANNVIINIPKERAKIGAVYDVFQGGEGLVDPDTGESLGIEETFVGKIIIVDIKPKYSVAEPWGKTKLEDLEKGMIVRPVNKEKEAIERKNLEQKKRKEFESRF